MKSVVLVLILCLACSIAHGQQSDADAPASREDVQRYMDAIHSQRLMQQTMEAMLRPMHKMVHDMYLKEKDKLPAGFEQKQMAMMDDMLRNMPLDEMMRSTIPVYQKHLTKRDISALVAFYSSPRGEKMMRELPVIMAETMEQMTPIMEKYLQTVQQRVQQEFASALKDSSKDSN